MTDKPDRDAATTVIGVSRGEHNNWERKGAAWREYAIQALFGNDARGREYFLSCARDCDLYGAFERTINRCADAT